MDYHSIPKPKQKSESAQAGSEDRYVVARHQEDGLTSATVSYVKNNIQNDFTLNDVADHLGVSYQYLSKMFSRCMGVSFREFVLREKMSYACVLLRKTDLSVLDIAKKLGYASPSVFARAFRRIKEKSPAEYRKSLRGEEGG